MWSYRLLIPAVLLIILPNKVSTSSILSPRQRVCYIDDHRVVDPDDNFYEDVSTLYGRVVRDIGEWYCVQYLAYDPYDEEKRVRFWRSSVSVTEYGEDFCSKVYAKYGDFLIYCYACDSDLCNNGNMWRPIERWFWIRSSAGASDLNIGWMSFLCGLTIVLLELCYPIG